MWEWVVKIGLGLVGLGVLVFVHELGHFIVGKLCGIRVTAFSIGFGRGIFSYERGGTLYKIGWLPIGGYCRFAGEGEDLSEDRKGAPDEFFERPAWARLATVSAGVVFNFIFAIVILGGLAWVGYSYEASDNRIVVVDKSMRPEDSLFPAAVAGLKTGDRIVSVNGSPTPNFKRVQEEVALRAEQTLVVKVLRDGKELTFRVTAGLRATGMGFINIATWLPAEIKAVRPGSPAAKAGLAAGDTLVSWGGETVESLDKLRALVQKGKGQPALLGVRRGGNAFQVRLAPENRHGAWLLGVEAAVPKPTRYQTDRYPLPQAVGMGFVLFADNIGKIVDGVALLFKPQVDKGEAIAGPARIIVISGAVIQNAQAAEILLFLALLSIALGFFNLLPIPAADGGHIVMTTIEMIRRRRWSMRVLQRVQMVGIAILLSLFVAVLFFDFVNLSKAKPARPAITRVDA